MHSTILILAALAPFALTMPAPAGSHLTPFIEARVPQTSNTPEHKKHSGGAFPHKSNGTEEHGLKEFSTAGKKQEHYHHHNGTDSHKTESDAKKFMKGKGEHNATEEGTPTQYGPSAGVSGIPSGAPESSSTGYPTTQARDLIAASAADLEPRKEHSHHSHHNGTEGAGGEDKKFAAVGEHHHHNSTVGGIENVPTGFGSGDKKMFTETGTPEHEHKQHNATETESGMPSPTGVNGAPPSISARAEPLRFEGKGNGTEGAGEGKGGPKELFAEHKHHKHNGTAHVTPEMADKAKAFAGGKGTGKGPLGGGEFNGTESGA